VKRALKTKTKACQGKIERLLDRAIEVQSLEALFRTVNQGTAAVLSEGKDELMMCGLIGV
jgi:hypothetical protein